MLGLRDLRTRDAGERVFVEFSIEADGRGDIREAFQIVAAAERAVEVLFPDGADVVGRCLPAGLKSSRRRGGEVRRRTKGEKRPSQA